MAFETIAVTYHERIATVTITRPDKLNALNAMTRRELGEAFNALKINPGVHVIILTGAGEKAFAAGTDIVELAALDQTSGTDTAVSGQRLFSFIEQLGKPVIAAVNGYALGGGCELALACHIRIASDNARFGQPEVNLGVIPGYGGTQRLARLVGRACAAEMILTGIPIDAEEARRRGLVSQVVPRADLLLRATAMANVIAGMGQVAVTAALEAIAAADLPLEEGLRKEAELFGRCCGSEDFKEGTAAFLEKRKPEFKNR